MSDGPKTSDVRSLWVEHGGEPGTFDQWLRSVKAPVWEAGYDSGRYVKKHRAREVRAANPYREQEEDEDDEERPDHCCGNCPPIAGGGYDCTCKGNPRCTKEDT